MLSFLEPPIFPGKIRGPTQWGGPFIVLSGGEKPGGKTPFFVKRELLGPPGGALFHKGAPRKFFREKIKGLFFAVVKKETPTQVCFPKKMWRRGRGPLVKKPRKILVRGARVVSSPQKKKLGRRE